MTQVNAGSGSQSLDTLLGSYKDPDAGKKKDSLGRDAFLTMLLAQLKNQDPLNPMNGTDFTAQLAQFSSLEQQFNTNDTLKAIQTSLDSKKQDNLIEYIGKQVEGNANTMEVAGGKASGGYFTIDSPADVSISVYDGSGSEVRTIYGGQMQPGGHSIDWDGKDNSGETAPDGNYVYQVTAVDQLGGLVTSKTSVEGLVTGVAYENGVGYLKVGDRILDPTTVTSVSQDTASSTAE